MKNDTILGYTDKEFYVLVGKLADGTPVYKFDAQLEKATLAHREQLKQKKQRILYEQRKKAIDEYNTQSEVIPNNPDEMLSKLHEEEEKERQIQARKDTLRYIVPEPVKNTVINEDSPSILDYYKEVKKESKEETDTACYLMLFQLDEQQRKEKRARIKYLQEQRQRAIEEDDRKRLQNADKYERMLNTLSRLEFDYHIQIREYVMDLEAELLEAYKHILKEEDYEELYTDDAEYDIVVHADVRAVVITNKDNNVTGTFNYYGNLQQNPEISGYKLRLYSMSKDEEETARFLRQNNNIREACVGIITHRHTTYDLRTGEIIENETFVVTKFDPEIVSTQECQYEIYNEADNKGIQFLPLAGSLVWSSGPMVSSYPGRGYGSSGKAFLDSEGVNGDVRSSYGGLPGISGRGGYVVSETDRASSTFIHVTSGSGMIQDIWLQRVGPESKVKWGNAGLGIGKGSIKYRTVTGPQAADTSIDPTRYADIFGDVTGHAVLTAMNAVCAEPGVDFTTTSGTLVWDNGEINGFTTVDGDDVTSTGYRQITGIQVLENFESEARFLYAPVSSIKHTHNDTDMNAPGLTRQSVSVDPIPFGHDPQNFRNQTMDRIFWVQLRDMGFNTAGASEYSLGPLKETTANSYPLSTIQYIQNNYKVREFGKLVYKNNVAWFGLSSQVHDPSRGLYVDYSDFYSGQEAFGAEESGSVTERKTIDSIPVRIPSRHHGFFTISYGIGSATGLFGHAWEGMGEFEPGDIDPDRGEFSPESYYTTLSRAHAVSGKDTLYAGYGEPLSTHGGMNKNWTIVSDGSMGGLCVIGVSRLSGCNGRVTVRVMLSAGIPDFQDSRYNGVTSIPNQSTVHSAARDGCTAWGWCGNGPGTYQYDVGDGGVAIGDLSDEVGRQHVGGNGYIGTVQREIYFKRRWYDVGIAGHTYGIDESLYPGEKGASGTGHPAGNSHRPHTWSSPRVNGYPLSATSSASTDPLSGNVGTLTWEHGEMGTKHIILEIGDMVRAMRAPVGTVANCGLRMMRWGCVFLSHSLERGPYLNFDLNRGGPGPDGVERDGPVLHDSISARNPDDPNNEHPYHQTSLEIRSDRSVQVHTLTPTPCCVIAGQAHGRDKGGPEQLGHNIYNDSPQLNTGFVGSSANPFFIGISGWIGYHRFTGAANPGGAADAYEGNPWW